MSDQSNNFVSDRTRLIRIQTSEYNLTMHDVRRRYLEIIWGTDVTEEFLKTLGYAVINSRAAPGVDFVETNPVEEDGVYYQGWKEIVPQPIDVEAEFKALKEEMMDTINGFVSDSMAHGVSFNFGSEEEPNILHIQIRDVDRVNILGMSIKSSQEDGAIQYFRTRENVTISVTAEQIRAMGDRIHEGYLAIKGAEWTLDDGIRGAEDKSTIPHIPSNFRDFYENFARLDWREAN